MTDSLSKELHDRTLTRIVERLGLREVTGTNGGPFLPLDSQMPMAKGPVGHVRVFRGGSIFQLVTSTIVVPQIAPRLTHAVRVHRYGDRRSALHCRFSTKRR